MSASPLAIGLDVGSTTVKAAVFDTDSARFVWRDYQRHETRQAEKLRELLDAIVTAYPGRELLLFITGSGAGHLAKPLSARFVQEVNAVTLAVERLHPDAGSAVELGGQDAKIILFQETVRPDGTVERRSSCSMNDKCASGTGATIDKCLLKVNAPEGLAQALRFDAAHLHHVAAKCGVFAETDIVNLVKSGIDPDEILCSLADAIVQQNLAVLTRGSTLRPTVLLLGGPNAFLPFLVDCWRHRIPETWASRGVEVPNVPVEELIRVPEDSLYFAAMGAVFFGLAEGAGVAFPGFGPLDAFLSGGRADRLANLGAKPLVRDLAELEAFRARYAIPPFATASFAPGQRVRGVIGLDGGSTSSKAVLVDHDSGQVLAKAYRLSEGNPIEDAKALLTELRAAVHDQGATLECTGFGATGYAAAVLQETLHADVNLVETVAHMKAAVAAVPDVDVVCDIGGQDIKVLFLAPNEAGEREVRDFRLSNQCSAGNGMLLQAMADQFGVPLEQYSDVAFGAALAPRFSYGCAVFLDADRVTFQKEGFQAQEMLAGLAQVLPKNVWQYVVQVPRLAQFGRTFVLQGGTQRNLAAVKAQVDYIEQRVPGANVVVHPHCGEAGALGAAMETRDVVRAAGGTRFVGLDQAIGVAWTATNDASTECHFCSNHCARTFIDATRPDGGKSRYIAGFSCEKGTVESVEAVQKLNRERRVRQARFPNLLAEEAKLAFAGDFQPAPLPAAGEAKDDVSVRRGWFKRVVRRTVRRGFRRSHADLTDVRIGMPRVLNLYALAPFFQAYFATLGLPKKNLVFSPVTSEELWAEGGRYGSIDPCFPSKVIQAHVHHLLFRTHADRRTGPLDYLYYPCITTIPSWVTHTMDNAACPVVAGSPNVIKAAFTKEVDFFERAGVRFIDAALTFAERNLLKRQLFETWGERLGVTEDESDFAVEQGWEALSALDNHLQARGHAILTEVEREDRLAVLVIGRPYHADPGLNHGIPEELQAAGYPVLSIRSIPKDRAWLQQRFGADDPLDIRDVWPENFSANSVQKVWAARFAARHPNVVLLDLSSFKCGHDAPTYSIIDAITRAARVPWMGMHDLDANKPGGSIQIRVRTFEHALEHAQTELTRTSRARAELRERVEAKRRELLGLAEPAAMAAK